jgi:hypothetical protein
LFGDASAPLLPTPTLITVAQRLDGAIFSWAMGVPVAPSHGAGQTLSGRRYGDDGGPVEAGSPEVPRGMDDADRVTIREVSMSPATRNHSMNTIERKSTIPTELIERNGPSRGAHDQWQSRTGVAGRYVLPQDLSSPKLCRLAARVAVESLGSMELSGFL